MNEGINITSYMLGKKAGGGSPAPTPTYQDKEITITTNGEQTITADTGYDALSSVEITTNVPQPSGKISITQNGTDIDVSSYATADVNVPAGADLSDYFNNTIGQGTTSTPAWWALIKKIPGPITASGTSLNYAFYNYPANFNIPIVDATGVTNFEKCFNGSSKTGVYDLSGWIIQQSGNVMMNFSSMFGGCKATEIDASCIGSFTGSQNKLFNNMFASCPNLKKVNLSNLDNSGMTSMMYFSTQQMFSNSPALEEIDMSKFNFTTLGSYSTQQIFVNVPTNCLILVKDQTQKDWFTTNWSSLTNVQIKSVYLANQGA